MPSTNTDYWQAKIRRNRDRDAAATQDLATGGWRVVTVWECSIDAGIEQLLAMLGTERSRTALPGSRLSTEISR